MTTDTTRPLSTDATGSTSPLASAIADILPLAIAVVPWGILCGSLALQVGLSAWQAQFMSLAVFAGAAQLAALGLISGGIGSLVPILGSTAVVSSRHLLYSAVLRPHVRQLPLRWRLALAFVLTDEMFAVSQVHTHRTGHFHYGYALVSGLVFYLVWNAATFAGIVLGTLVSGIDQLGFDFAIAAIFIAMVVPSVQSRAMLAAVTTSAVVAVAGQLLQLPHSLLLASLTAMTVGYWLDTPKEART